MGSFRERAFFALGGSFKVRISASYVPSYFIAKPFIRLGCRGKGPCLIAVFFALPAPIIQAFS